MKKQITISLALIGVVFAIGIAVPALLAKGGKANQSVLEPLIQPAPVTSTPSPIAIQLMPGHTPTTGLTQSQDCTYTYYYWRDRPYYWPDQVQIAGNIILKSQAIRLMQAPNIDINLGLQRSIYVTLLNINSGANRSTIDVTIKDASDWLAANPEGTPLSVFNQSIASAFTQALDDYNNGVVGPGLCANQPPTPTPAASMNALGQQSSDITPVPTARRRSRRLNTAPAAPPPQQPQPTPVPPTSTPLPPTNTPQPPTNTPLPPTNPPPTLAPTPVPNTPTPVSLPIPTVPKPTKEH